MVPTVSIITPALNAAAHIEATLASVMAQTLADWELLIVNDGSTDATRAILDRLEDPRIRVFHQSNAGVSAARNTALDAARGVFITFLDADDLLPADALRIRVSFLERHPDIDIVNGCIRITSSGNDVHRYIPDLIGGPLFERLVRLEEGVFQGPFYMLRRDRMAAHRFPVGVSHCEDAIFFLTLAHDQDLRYGAVAEEIYEYRRHKAAAMNNMIGLEAGYMALAAHTRALARVEERDRRVQSRHIASVLIKSWLKRGRLLRALAVPGKLRRAQLGGRGSSPTEI